MPQADPAGTFIFRGFVVAGAVNVFGMLIFSKAFTNSLFSDLDPAVFSWPGIVAVILWGLAFWSVARSYHRVPLIVLVFFLEKMLYTATWLTWLATKGGTLTAVFAESPLTAVGYASYGAVDFVIGLFFLWVAVRSYRRRQVT